MRTLEWTVILAATATLVEPPVVHASTLKQRSIVMPIELGDCKVASTRFEGNRWSCRGLKNYPLYVAEGDLRWFVSVGPKPEKRRAAEQTLGAFNTIFPTNSKRALLEWRMGPGGQLGPPIATIVRYYTSRDGAKGEVLVVSKVSANETCHMAYIDAKATVDALPLARSIADERAVSFDCRMEPKIEGTRGKSPM